MEAFSHLLFHLDYHNKTWLIKGMTASFTFDIAFIIYWRRDRLPTPVFWPGKFHGLSYSPWGRRVRHAGETFTFTFHFDHLFWHQVNSLAPGELPSFCSHHYLLFNFVLVLLAWDIRQRNKMESILTEKELFLFIADMIIYIDSSNVSTKNSLKNKELQKQTPCPPPIAKYKVHKYQSSLNILTIGNWEQKLKTWHLLKI